MNRVYRLFLVLALLASSNIAAFASGDGWFTNFEEAKKSSAQTGRPILANFTGSDWCIWCKKLKSEVLSQSTFIDYAKNNLVLMEVDFPRNKKLPSAVSMQNQKLMQQYGIMGFPTILLIDSKGNVLAQTGYKQGGAKKYIQHIKELLGQ